MDKICIRKSPTADDKLKDGQIYTVEQLRESTNMHIDDVRLATRFIAERIEQRGEYHDHTKLENMENYHAALTSGHITDSDWYKLHTSEERHHLNHHVPDDVTFIDVIEYLCDCVMAGMARSGTVYDIRLAPEVLTLAMNNTVELLKASTYIADESAIPVDPMDSDI